MSPSLPITVKGAASFRQGKQSWSSHNAWAVFVVYANGKIRCCRTYAQFSKSNHAKASPYFMPDEWKRMQGLAAKLAQKRRDGAQSATPLVRFDNAEKPHPQELCERCIELGMPCTGQLYDVCGKSFTAPRKVLTERQKRLEQGPVVILYHQTSPKIAQLILDSQEMKPGTQGLAGGGIYFARSAKETERKAQQHGVILECTVRLGEVYELASRGDPDMDITKLLNMGFDSVKVNRGRPEWVVYMSDQVTEIRKYRRQ